MQLHDQFSLNFHLNPLRGYFRNLSLFPGNFRGSSFFRKFQVIRSFQEILRSANKDSLEMFIRAILTCLVLARIIHQGGTDHSTFVPELECSHKGGICVHDSECEQQFRHNSSSPLCEQQSLQGAVCCTKIPDTWTECSRRGGECFSSDQCNPILIDTKGHCDNGLECCILI